jgi:hypothetical protein
VAGITLGVLGNDFQAGSERRYRLAKLKKGSPPRAVHGPFRKTGFVESLEFAYTQPQSPILPKRVRCRSRNVEIKEAPMDAEACASAAGQRMRPAAPSRQPFQHLLAIH